MAASYLVKKSDTYYFRHYIPTQNQKQFGKKEFIKTLKVSRKSTAVRLSRELKIVFDLAMEKAAKQPSITWQEIRDTVDRAFDIIYKRYTQNVEIHGPDFNDNYEPYHYIPPEYEQFVLIEDSTMEWGDIGKIHELADKIIDWAKLKLDKGSREYNLFCFRTIQMLYEHSDRKRNPWKMEPNILEEISEKLSHRFLEVNPNTSSEQSNGERYLLTDIFQRYWEETSHKWIESTVKEYKGNFANIFSLLEIASGKLSSELYLDEITYNVVNTFIADLKHLPCNFTKRFQGKMLLSEAIQYSKMLDQGEKIELDEKIISHIKQKNKPTTLNRKYIKPLRNLLTYACDCGFMKENPIAQNRIIPSPKVGSTHSFRPFQYSELEQIFSDDIFTKKQITHKQNEYKGIVPYFKYWLPILGVYCGAREGEIAQLRVKDIQCVDNIHYLKILKSEDTSIKTDSSERSVPLHPDIIKIGFCNYVQWLKNNGQQYLFPELEGRKKKGAPVSKWFVRFLKVNRNVINESQITKIGFHSFRNNVVDEFKQKAAVEHVASGLVGHKNKNVTYGVYGSEMRIKESYENLVKYLTYEGVKFPWRDNPDYFEIKKFPWEK